MSAGQYDPLDVNRDMEMLAPAFREGVRAAIAECNANGLDAYVYEGHRSAELQALYYKRGRTIIPPKKPVTNARSNLYSWHGYGLAVDVISRSKGWSDESFFPKIAAIFLKHGCKWGGHWKSPDPPHFQWHLCKPSPSDRARELLHEGGVEAVWKAVGASGTGASHALTSHAPGTPAGLPSPPGRVLFARAASGARSVRGALIRRVQEGLGRERHDPGEIDGIFGGDTERALLGWQAAVGAPPTGRVDVQTWTRLVSPVVPSVYERALQVTAAFEGHGFGLAGGNWDGAWLTWGIIGFNLRSGTLGPLLREIRQEHPQVFATAFGSLEHALVRMLEADAGEKEIFCNRISAPPRGRKLVPEWSAAFDRLGATPEAQQIQMRYAEPYWRTALRDADRLNLRTELGLALCFDIAVQNGGVDNREEAEIRRRMQSKPPREEQGLRVIVADVVAEHSRREYVEDVRSRKRTLATGTGHVHGASYDVRSWGLDDLIAS